VRGKFEEMNKARRKLGLPPIPENMEVIFMGKLDRFFEAVGRREEKLSYEVKKRIIQSLAYSLNMNVGDVTTRKIVMQDFIASMNRKKLIENYEVDELLRYAYSLIGAL